MSYPFDEPNEKDYDNYQAYLHALWQWREAKEVEEERDRRWREMEEELKKGSPQTSSPLFGKLSLFLAHVFFFAMICTVIFDPQQRVKFLETIADKNVFISFLKGAAFVAIAYIFCILISPIMAFAAVVGVVIAVIGFFSAMLT